MSEDRLLNQILGLYESGRLPEALALCERALPLTPGSALMAMYGALLLERGDAALALSVLRPYVAAVADDASAWSNLGMALRSLASVEEACAAFQQAVRLAPEDPWFRLNLALALLAHGEPAVALPQAEAALRLGARVADTWLALGIAHRELEHHEPAERCFRQILTAEPNHLEALNHLGLLLRRAGRYDEAVAVFERLCAVAPEHEQANANLADLYEAGNRLDEARQAAELALRRGPDATATLALARIERRQGQAEQAIQRLEALRAEGRAGALEQEIAFELGRLYDVTRQYDKAFAALMRGNELAMRRWSGDLADPRNGPESMPWLRSEFQMDEVLAWPELVPADDFLDPVFVIGFPRSGTTLLEQVLDAHPGLQALDEKPAVEQLRLAVEALPSGYPKALGELTDAELRGLRASYFSAVSKYLSLRPGCRLVDKYPLNIVRLGLIQRVFPKAKFILALRHPCDVSFSCFMQNFKLNDGMVGFSTLESTAAIYARVMELWREQLPIFRPDVHVIRYEDMVEDFRGEVRHLTTFLELPWTEDVMNYAEHALSRGKINTPSYHQVVRPIYKDSRYRWLRYREYFSEAMPHLLPWLEHYGYPAE